MSEFPLYRLADATAPCLQQHARDPVDWRPWCEEILERAAPVQGVASMCRGTSCWLPLDSPAALLLALTSGSESL